METKMTKKNIEDLLNKYIKDKWYVKYYKDTASYVWEVSNGVVVFHKPNIETRFCFDDENERDLYNYKHFNEYYFLKENLSSLDNQINDCTESYKDNDTFYLANTGHGYTVCNNIYNTQNIELIEMSDNQIEEYISILKLERDKFEKRLQTYLKRYGLSKIHKWTYWANA